MVFFARIGMASSEFSRQREVMLSDRFPVVAGVVGSMLCDLSLYLKRPPPLPWLPSSQYPPPSIFFTSISRNPLALLPPGKKSQDKNLGFCFFWRSPATFAPNCLKPQSSITLHLGNGFGLLEPAPPPKLSLIAICCWQFSRKRPATTGKKALMSNGSAIPC